MAVLTLRREDGRIVCERVMVSDRAHRRMRGLLGRRYLRSGEGMVLRPGWSIHTAFMRFPIDLVFVARDGRVLKTASAVRPWRIRVAWRAFAVVELPAGSLDRSGTVRGDVVTLRTIV